MDINSYEALSVASLVICILGFVRYIWTTLQGTTKLTKATWIIWSILDIITLVGMHAKGSVNGLIIGSTLGAWTVMGLSFFYGAPGWTIIDYLCLLGAALGMLLWALFGNPLLGVLMSLAMVILGSVPLWIETWQDPAKEDKVTWTVFWLSCVVAVVGIPRWTLADAAQPITFLGVESVVMYLIFVRARPPAAESNAGSEVVPDRLLDCSPTRTTDTPFPGTSGETTKMSLP